MITQLPKRFLTPAALLYALLVFSTGLPAQSGLSEAMEALTKAANMKHAGIGMCVIDVSSGRVVASRQADLSLIPASTLKVLTTATALAMLGPTHRFRTTLEYDGAIDSRGNLTGNLYLHGYGDPTLGSPEMADIPDLAGISEQFRLAVQQQGIRRIEGFVVGDGSYFATDVNAPTWQWYDLGNYYAAGAWGLNIHENRYELRFQQTAKLGATPSIVAVEPEVPELVFHNEVSSAARGSGDNAYIYGAPYTFERYIRGTIPVGNGLFSIKGSLPDAPLFAAQYLMRDLERVGIRTTRGAATQLELGRRGEGLGRRQVLLTYESPPLREIVNRANTESVNLYCEVLLRHLGQARNRQGSREAGIEALLAFWRDRGLDAAGCFLEDGSGLSPRNGVTARFLAAVLRKVALDQRIFPAFQESLPAAGQSGILENRLRGTAAVGRLWAKSGTLDRVRTYAGFARTRSGKLLAFALLINNFDGSGATVRQQLEEIMLTMCR